MPHLYHRHDRKLHRRDGSIQSITTSRADRDTLRRKSPFHPLFLQTLIESQTCIAVLYITISYILYFDSLLPFLISTGLDSAILIAVIVVAVTVGKPLSYLDCAALPSSGATSSFLDSVGINMSKVNYWVWAGASKTTCYEMKAIWGLSIALCILFAFSGVISVCLWRRQQMFAPGKDVEDN
jgi:hypothetical protein